MRPKITHRLDSVHADKTKDFPSGTGEGTYAIVIPAEQTMSCILIDPDEKMLDHMQQWMGMKMFRD